MKGSAFFHRVILAAMILGLALLAWGAISPTCASADVTLGGSIAGSVHVLNGGPIPGAIVSISGPTSATSTTDNTGSFRFENIPFGTYQIQVERNGYRKLVVTDVAVSLNQPANVSISLESVTLNSVVQMATIRVSAKAHSFNTTPAALTIIDRRQLQSQGLQQVDKALNEIPGIQATLGWSGYPSLNPSIPSAQNVISIRGAQPDESAVLIDGHRIASAASGYYSPSYLNAFTMETVESIRGPGASSPQIANAINGTVNIRLREPTRYPEGDLDLGMEGFGGLFSDFGFTGTSPSGKWGWVITDGVRGSPGPFNEFRNITTGDFLRYDGRVVNGVVQTDPASGSFIPPAGSAPFNPNVVNNNFRSISPLVLCCAVLNSAFTDHSQMARLRHTFSPATSLTVTFLGGQQFHDFYGSTGYEFPFTFSPCLAHTATGPCSTLTGPGYAGPIAPGNYGALGFIGASPSNDAYHFHIYETDFRTTINKDVLLARYYGFYLWQAQSIGQVGGTTQYVRAYGTLDPGISGVSQQVFNGDLISVTATYNTPFANELNDKSHGFSLEYNHPMGPNLLTLSADDTKLNSAGTTTVLPPNQGFPPPGTFARLRTELLRGIFELGNKTELTVANYYSSYQLNFVTAFGKTATIPDTFMSTISPHFDPRVGLVIRPNPNMALRAGIGSGIAPISLGLFFPSTPPYVQPGNSFAAEFLENTGLKPETAFGYDVGADFRLRNPDTVVSVDLFMNNLFNELLTEQINLGTQTFIGDSSFSNGLGPGQSCVCTVIATEFVNVGRARYEGVELGVQHNPNVGFGYTVTGTLLHAYPYGLSPAFFNSKGDPNGAPDTNLAVVPGNNFHGYGSYGAPGSTGGFSTSVPYSSGYAELGYRFRNGIALSVGETYFGSNNSYNLPAFFVGNANADFPLKGDRAIHVSVDNLFNIYPRPVAADYAGIPMVLVNHQIGLDQATYQGPRLLKVVYSQHYGPH